MAKKYTVMVWINVMGKCSQAEGCLEITLPFVPDMNLEIADLHVGEHLCVESVSWSHQAKKFAVWMAGITDPTRKLSSLLSKFVGEWEWDFSPLPKELTDEAIDEAIDGEIALADEPPKPKRKPIGEEGYRKAAEDLLRGRGNTLPRNPRTDEPATPEATPEFKPEDN